jgi:two-component system invasion response regulator UvrY
MIDVLLVDDHDLVRCGIRRLLQDADNIRVASEASCGEDALEYVMGNRPDVVLMDVSMPGIGGLEATRRMLQHDSTIGVIILTVHTGDPFPARLLRAGARGYLTKDSSVQEMVHAIEEVHSGGRYVSPGIAQTLALSGFPENEDDSPLARLSQREMQVFLMLMRGDKPGDISEKLHLSPKTISTYRNRLYDKLGVRSDAELTRLAMRYGLLEGVD